MNAWKEVTDQSDFIKSNKSFIRVYFRLKTQAAALIKLLLKRKV